MGATGYAVRHEVCISISIPLKETPMRKFLPFVVSALAAISFSAFAADQAAGTKTDNDPTVKSNKDATGTSATSGSASTGADKPAKAKKSKKMKHKDKDKGASAGASTDTSKDAAHDNATSKDASKA